MEQMKNQRLFGIYFMVFKQAIQTVGRHTYLILFPLVLDLFLLLGPRLSVSNLLNPILTSLPSIENFEQQFGLTWKSFISQILESISQFNAFSALKSLPFGLPSLLSQRSSLATPFGFSHVFELNSFGLVFLVFFLLSILGVLMIAIYFHLLNRAVFTETALPSRPGNSILFLSVNFMGLNIITWILAIALVIPFALILGLLLRLSQGLGFVAYMLATMVVLSFVLPMVFTPYYIVAERVSFIKAAKNSVKLYRKSSILTSLFIVLCVTIYYLTNLLWNSAPNTSPFVLFGIFGHALVVSILLSSSFYFINWLEKVDFETKTLNV